MIKTELVQDAQEMQSQAKTQQLTQNVSKKEGIGEFAT